MYPKLYTRDGQLQAVLDNVIKDTAVIKRVVNGEFTFSFEAFERDLKSEYFAPNNNIVIDSQAFDIKYIEQSHDTDIKYSIQCEHVNYRLIDGDSNKYTSYGFVGTPTQILTDILAGTEFNVGVVNYTDVIGFVVNTEITKKSLIYQLVNMLGGEVEYTNNGFTINILNTIGQDNGFEVRFGKNLKGIKKIIDNRGELKTTYDVDLIELKNSNQYIEQGLQGLEVVGVGDTIRIIDEVIGINVQNRVLSIEYNPIMAINSKLAIANTIELISDSIQQIDTSTVHKGTIYNGVRISPDDGFVAERSDGKTITSMDATNGIRIQSDVGNGLQLVFYVDSNGRIKGSQLDIDGSSTFNGTVDITNGPINIKMAATGSDAFKISNNNIPIFYIDGNGTGTFSGNVIGSTIEGSTFIAHWPNKFANDRIMLSLDQSSFNSEKISGGLLVGKGAYSWQSIELSTTQIDEQPHTSIKAGDILLTDINHTLGPIFEVNKNRFHHNGNAVLDSANYGSYIGTAGITPNLTEYGNIDFNGSVNAAAVTWVQANYAEKSHTHEYATIGDINSAIAWHVSEYHAVG